MRAGGHDELSVLRARVDSQERELRGAVAELGYATSRSVDLTRWVHDYPWACLAGALSLGFWLGVRD